MSALTGHKVTWRGEIRSVVCDGALPTGEGPPHDEETGNVDAVLDGDIDKFLAAYCAGDAAERVVEDRPSSLLARRVGLL